VLWTVSGRPTLVDSFEPDSSGSEIMCFRAGSEMGCSPLALVSLQLKPARVSVHVTTVFHPAASRTRSALSSTSAHERAALDVQIGLLDRASIGGLCWLVVSTTSPAGKPLNKGSLTRHSIRQVVRAASAHPTTLPAPPAASQLASGDLSNTTLQPASCVPPGPRYRPTIASKRKPLGYHRVLPNAL